MKTLIVIRGTGNTGKTQSITKVHEIFKGLKELDTSPGIEWIKPAEYDENGDFKAVLEYRGKTIGIESLGDANSCHKEWLEELANDYSCDIIVGATHEGDETHYNVDDIVNTYGYDLVRVISKMRFEADKKDESLYNMWNRQIAEGILLDAGRGMDYCRR